MNLRSLRVALFLPCLSWSAAAPAEIDVADFFGDFEGASLISLRKLGRNWFSIEAQSNTVYGNQGSLMTWACGGVRLHKVAIAKGDTLRIQVPNGNKGANLRAVYSHDRKQWRPVERQRASFDFEVPLESGLKRIYFATFYPYVHSQMLQHNRKVSSSKYAKVSVIGKTIHGRQIPLITIAQGGQATRKAFILGGTHGQESASMYGVEGMIDFLLSDDALAGEMRRNVIWKIIPIHNVDAAAEGLDRRNAGGINLYFDWGFHEQMPANPVKDPSGKKDPAISLEDFSQPETRSAWDAIEAFRPDVFLDVHSWHFAGDGYWGPDPAAEGAAIDALKNSIAKHFRIQHWNHEQYPYASAPTVARRLNIAATLPEFALSFDSEKKLKSPESMRQQGIRILTGAYEYLRSLGAPAAIQSR